MAHHNAGKRYGCYMLVFSEDVITRTESELQSRAGSMSHRQRPREGNNSRSVYLEIQQVVFKKFIDD